MATGAPPEKPNIVCRQYDYHIKETQWPIIYSSEYNIGFCGLEKLHPFDSGKWGRIFEFLKGAGMLRDDTVVEPIEASEEELRFVHTKRYICSLRWSMNVAGITEVPPVALLPNYLVQKKVLRPFRFQTSGTIMAGRLAMERGWAINIGGGFHHCSADRGGGFCAYADITLSIKFAFEKIEGVSKVMIVDLDAHQGNGHERDFMEDPRVYIFDVYNRGIYPHDGYAKRAIHRKVELQHHTDDDTYLDAVRNHMEGALNEFNPDLVVYNAGTDILQGDPLGNLSITPQGIIERDQIVFQKCRTRGIPVFMVTSGGYLRETARIVADSILNLKSLNLIGWDAAENAPLIEEKEFPIPRSRSDGGLFARFKRSCLSRSNQSISSLVSPTEEQERMVAVKEVQSKENSSDRKPTVFLSEESMKVVTKNSIEMLGATSNPSPLVDVVECSNPEQSKQLVVIQDNAVDLTLTDRAACPNVCTDTTTHLDESSMPFLNLPVHPQAPNTLSLKTNAKADGSLAVPSIQILPATPVFPPKNSSFYGSDENVKGSDSDQNACDIKLIGHNATKSGQEMNLADIVA